MANNFTPVGSELQVNQDPNQNFDQVDPDVAVLTDGRFFVAFEDNEGIRNIFGQFVNPDGTLSGSNIDIGIDTSEQADAAVAQRAAGAAVVVWTDATVGFDIQYSIVSSGGAPAPNRPFSAVPTRWLLRMLRRLPMAAPLWSQSKRSPSKATSSSGSSMPPGIRLALLDIVDDGAGDQSDPAVAAFGNNALVVYRDDTDGHLRYPGPVFQWRQLRDRSYGRRHGPRTLRPGRGGPDRRPLHRRLERRVHREHHGPVRQCRRCAARVGVQHHGSRRI